MKLSVMLVNIYCIPSALNKFLISTISPSLPGCSTRIPNGCNNAERRRTAKAKIANNVTGCGSLLPTTSIPSSER